MFAIAVCNSSKVSGCSFVPVVSKLEGFNQVAAGRLIYDCVSSKYEHVNRDCKYKQWEYMRFSACTLLLLLATMSQSMMRYNISARSNVLVQESIVSLFRKVIFFNFTAQLIYNINNAFRNACYTSTQLSQGMRMIQTNSGCDGVVVVQ